MSNEASQSSSKPEDASTPEHDNASTSQQAAFRPSTILKIVVPIALLMFGGVIFFGAFDGAEWFSNMAKPARLPVVGRVTYNGEVLPDAVIETRPVDTTLSGAFGSGDDQGGFKLVTQINGQFLDGAYAGEHKVTIKRYDMNAMSLGTPPLLTPGVYASFDTSPLRIEVKKGETDFLLELEGEPESTAVRPGSGFRMRPPGSDEPNEGRRRGRRDDTSNDVETEQNSSDDAAEEEATSDDAAEEATSSDDAAEEEVSSDESGE
jgi:hypothetical protein